MTTTKNFPIGREFPPLKRSNNRQMLIETILFLFIIQTSHSSEAPPTAFVCTESLNETSRTQLSCLPGYVIDIESVIYHSTIDNKCSSLARCEIENKNALAFACNRKPTCQIDLKNLHFYINSTCGSTVRFFTKYRCLPVIYEQKDCLTESSASRRGDINLSCGRNYRLYINMAYSGLSVKPQDDTTRNRLKCNKDTQRLCNHHVSNDYRRICDRQRHGDQCKIRHNERPMLNDCSYGTTSNYSFVEYSCIPGNGITEDLPRIDICSSEIPERISVDRGILFSSNNPLSSCRKQLHVPREARLRLFMLEKSIESPNEFSIYLLNQIRTLTVNELIDTTITNSQSDETVQFDLKTIRTDNGEFSLYFQVDSRMSDYAPFDLEHSKQRTRIWKRDWAIVIGCIIILLLILILMAFIFIMVRMSKRRRARSLRYLKGDDDHREHLNPLPSSADRHHNQKNLEAEQPYLISSSPTILPLPSSGHGHNRPNSSSSTTSSSILHRTNDGISDCEALIKSTDDIGPRSNLAKPDIDNPYEEIKEQQQQTALALGMITNRGNRSSAQPIRDHHETEPRYQHPASSNAANEPMKSSDRPLPSPTIPPQRMDFKHAEPSAPPFHLLDNDQSGTP